MSLHQRVMASLRSHGEVLSCWKRLLMLKALYLRLGRVQQHFKAKTSVAIPQLLLFYLRWTVKFFKLASTKQVSWKAALAFQRQSEMLQHGGGLAECKSLHLLCFLPIKRFERSRLGKLDQMHANIKASWQHTALFSSSFVVCSKAGLAVYLWQLIINHSGKIHLSKSLLNSCRPQETYVCP